jgi:hypothetical protein
MKAFSYIPHREKKDLERGYEVAISVVLAAWGGPMPKMEKKPAVLHLFLFYGTLSCYLTSMLKVPSVRKNPHMYRL